jgi:hypothetical protein
LEEPLVISDRYRGFENVAHGGYVAGLLAKSLGAGAEVVLRKPPPMGRPLAIEANGEGGITLRDGETIVAEAAPAPLELELPLVVTFDEAEEASRAYPGHAAHPFPTCFGCGPDRAHGDALRLFPGALDGSPVVAAPFEPPAAFGDESGMVGSELAWAAVDCPQLWALMHAAPRESTERVVTSRLAASVPGQLRAGDRYVVLAWPAGHDGNRLLADAAILSEAGEPVAFARQTSTVVDGSWGVPLGLGTWHPHYAAA